jgi:ribosomal protein L7Ae-like RNA K-turn-binding protein
MKDVHGEGHSTKQIRSEDHKQILISEDMASAICVERNSDGGRIPLEMAKA